MKGNTNPMRIAIVGAGYVGLSIAVLLSQQCDVTLYDIDAKRVEAINSKRLPVINKQTESFLSTRNLCLKATSDYKEAYANADYVIISVPTDYCSLKNGLDVTEVETAINQIFSVNIETCVIIKSTVPIGFTKEVSCRFNCNILFSPEFLRESYAYYDSLYPTRVIVGFPNNNLKQRAFGFAQLIKNSCKKKDVETMVMTSSEAEAVKFFSNAYLAMRIGFFNELDTFAELSMLNSASIIKGVCLDPRVGDYYNNPSFGYGGYCLPKDTKQLLANYGYIPQHLIGATISSNELRKDFIAKQILQSNPRTIGIYRFTIKINSDNFRNSPVAEVLQRISIAGVTTVVYEPTLSQDVYLGCRVIQDIADFKNICDVIVANRIDNNIADVLDKVYTRDLFCRD